jgi:NADP-dependent alcohol dehydrogenase
MMNFEFYNPTRILFGKDKLPGIDKNIPADATVLITYGGGSAKKSGLLNKVKTILGKRKVYEFAGIEPNPRYETLVRAIEMVRKENITFILAVGGGSVIDGTKFISLGANYTGDLRDLLKYGFTPVTGSLAGPVVPFGTVLTLPATGSEMNSGAVITYDHGKYP